jgi:hypothetical protein
MGLAAGASVLWWGRWRGGVAAVIGGVGSYQIPTLLQDPTLMWRGTAAWVLRGFIQYTNNALGPDDVQERVRIHNHFLKHES